MTSSKKLKAIIALIVCAVLTFSIAFSASANAYDPNKDYNDLSLKFVNEKADLGFYINASEKYLLETIPELQFGTGSGEWSAMDLLRGMYTGYDYINQIPSDYFDNYIKVFEDYVISQNGILHKAKSTEYSRLILALSSLGYDVTNVAPHYRTGGYNGTVCDADTDGAVEYSYDFLLKYSVAMSYLYKQGINGPIWTLIALNTGDYSLYTKDELQAGLDGADEDLAHKMEALNITSIEDESKTVNANTGRITNKGVSTEGKLLEYILSCQVKQTKGDYAGVTAGWALTGSNPDPDMTGMALQALAPYYFDEDRFNEAMDNAYYSDELTASYTYEDLKTAVENAVWIMSEIQAKNGGYSSWGSINSESIAQIIVALTELKIDPLAEEVYLPTIDKTCSFVKDGNEYNGVTTNNMIDAILSFWANGSGSTGDIGGFKHVTAGSDGGSGSGTDVNGMATDQATYALIAYDRFLKGQNSLYNMTDMTDGSYVDAIASTNTLTFNLGEMGENKTLSYSPYQTITVPSQANTEEYTFDSWNTSKDGSGVRLDADDVLSTTDSDITLYAIYTKNADPLAVDVSMASGASIRLNEPNGIRFYTYVDQDKIAELRASGATVEMGTLIAPKDYLVNEELTLDLVATKRCVNVEFNSEEYYTKDDFTGVVGSIVNIKDSTTKNETSGNIAREFVGRGYVKVTKDGKTTISYATYTDGNIDNNSRSLAYVANALKLDTANYEKLNDAKKALVEKWSAFYKD